MTHPQAAIVLFYEEHQKEWDALLDNPEFVNILRSGRKQTCINQIGFLGETPVIVMSNGLAEFARIVEQIEKDPEAFPELKVERTVN